MTLSEEDINSIVKKIVDKIDSSECCDDSDNEKSFKSTSFDTKQKILDKVAVHYNNSVVNSGISGKSGAHLVRSNRNEEECCRYRCTNNHRFNCKAAIWITKTGKLRDTLNQHHTDCIGKTSKDSNNISVLISTFIDSNRDAYDRALYHLAYTSKVVKKITADNLYQLFSIYMMQVEKVDVDSTFRNKLGSKLQREVNSFVHDGKKREYQVQALIEFFKQNTERFVWYEGKEKIDGQVVYTHISWIDKRFSHFKSKKKFKVFSKDVTFGVIDSNSGFDKLSTISGLNADHTVDPLCFTMLVSETKNCFLEEMNFFMTHYPWLSIADTKSTWFVDGDRANISAVETTVCPGSPVVLCLYHFTGMYIYLSNH